MRIVYHMITSDKKQIDFKQGTEDCVVVYDGVLGQVKKTITIDDMYLLMYDIPNCDMLSLAEIIHDMAYHLEMLKEVSNKYWDTWRKAND